MARRHRWQRRLAVDETTACLVRAVGALYGCTAPSVPHIVEAQPDEWSAPVTARFVAARIVVLVALSALAVACGGASGQQTTADAQGGAASDSQALGQESGSGIEEQAVPADGEDAVSGEDAVIPVDDETNGDNGDTAAHQADLDAENAGTVTVVISSGPEAGSYQATGPVSCSAGVWSANHWDLQYQNDDALEGELRSVLLNSTPEHADDATTGLNTFSASVTIGPYTYPEEHVLMVVVDGPNGTTGSGTGQLSDDTVTAQATTEDGVGLTISAACSFGL